MKIKRFFTVLLVCLSMISSSVYAQSEAPQEKISLNFKDTDIKVVLQALSEKGGVNIVPSPEVGGTVSIKLKDVDWQTALEVLLRTYDYGYAKFNDIVMVAPLEKIKEREASEKEREAVEPPQMRIFELKYLDANDAIVAIQPMLSASGRVSVLRVTGQAGWEFGEDITKRERASEGRVSRSKKLIVTDISKKLDSIERLLEGIDIMPKQILIQAKIMEVSHDDLEDIGFQWGTGSAGVSSGAGQQVTTGRNLGSDAGTMAMHSLAGGVTAVASGTGNVVGTDGLEVVYKKLGGTEFEAILNLLSETVGTNVLSSPSVLTLNNQEASILVGEKFPIVEIEVSEETSQITGGSLDKYQDIGIQLNVVPQIAGENGEFINMIVHPAVTSYTDTVKVIDQNNTTLVEYPKINSRETETQVLVKNGETIVIGGLMKDSVIKTETGVPLLKDIPILGRLFKRNLEDQTKIDLLIFLTATIVTPGEIMNAKIVDTDAMLDAFGSDLPESAKAYDYGYEEVMAVAEEDAVDLEEDMAEEDLVE